LLKTIRGRLTWFCRVFIWCVIAFIMIISLCMRWLYVLMLCGLRVMTWWLEPRDCHVNVNIVEIAYRLQVTMASIHGGPRRGEGVLGAGWGAIISCHGGISEFGATATFSEAVATATFSEIATTTMFFYTIATTTKYWPSRHSNWRLKMITEIPGAQGYTISCFYELCEMFIPLLFAPFDCAIVNYYGDLSR
jgi:hypothetical protein